MSTKSQAVATGNIGCMSQLADGLGVPILHTVELLDWATGGPVPSALAGRISPLAIAANQVVLNVASFVFMIPLGLSAAAAVRVGQAVGRRDAPGLRIAGSSARMNDR